MTIDDLLDVIDGLDGKTEVRLAIQPHWPFEYSIERAMLKSELEFDDDEEEDDSTKQDDDDDDDVLYLTQGTQLGYTTKKWWD